MPEGGSAVNLAGGKFQGSSKICSRVSHVSLNVVVFHSQIGLMENEFPLTPGPSPDESGDSMTECSIL